jgi:hypothetical protein
MSHEENELMAWRTGENEQQSEQANQSCHDAFSTESSKKVSKLKSNWNEN